jgi:hypothetical protein
MIAVVYALLREEFASIVEVSGRKFSSEVSEDEAIYILPDSPCTASYVGKIQG